MADIPGSKKRPILKTITKSPLAQVCPRGAASDPYPLRNTPIDGANTTANGTGDPTTATAILKITIRLDGQNADNFDRLKIAMCKTALATATGVRPSQVGLKIARGRVVRKTPVAKSRTEDDEAGDKFFDAEEENQLPALANQ